MHYSPRLLPARVQSFFFRYAGVCVASAILTACGGGSDSAASTAPPPPPPAGDTTAPVLSAIGATPATTSASVSWTTSEAADTQVEFGPNTSYGSASTLDSAMATSHAANLTSLTSATQYHFRVKSRDAAGNLATGTDMTFTTTSAADTTAPTVSLTAPAASATVSGSVSVTATAADNVGVSNVQFRLDGANLGSADSSSPYSVSWDTTAAGNGAHTLTAVARDAAGNTTTSTAVSVTVNNVAAPGDTTAPTVSVTAPANSATVSGTLNVTANASDNVGVLGVQFRIDSSNLGTEDLSSPYSISWNTTGVANGAHTLRAIARDAAGNQTTSAVVNVTVNNAAPPNGAAITVGQIEVDPPTLITLGVSLPITSGDTNHNASVTTSYRKVGDASFKTAMPLLRVRPELLSTEDPTGFDVPEQFAGSIFDLTPDTDYEIKLDVHDPDGGDVSRSVTAHTRPQPLANPGTPHAVAVSTQAQLTTAINGALPGDVITLANGTYTGGITITRSGTAANPIFIRGASRDGAIINAPGVRNGIEVDANYVTVENLTVQASSWGMSLTGASSNAVIRKLHITNVSYGIEAKGGSKHDFYICDNLMEGKAVWPTVDSSVWDFEGIVITGTGHVVCYNTMSGFGDALGQHYDTDIPNRANDFYGNDIVWTGDNGVELDFTERNCRAFRNRFANAGNQSISFQPVYGGPAYAFRNVVFNTRTSPFKLNNTPTGVIIVHNTVVKPGITLAQYGSDASNLLIENNILIGTNNNPTMDVTTNFTLATIDYNGWLQDGTFVFNSQGYTPFATLKANSPIEHNGRVLNGMPFAASVTVPADYTSFVQAIDPRLSATTNAIDAGVVLPNINDGFAGANPDLGAIERGDALPQYGVRP
jgi:hypothetical protein